MFQARFSMPHTLAAFGEFNLAFPLSPPEVTGLLGPSGCGKTTALKVIAGLIRPTEGVIRFRNRTWWEAQQNIFLPPQARGAALLHQQPALFPHLTAAANIRYGFPAKPDPVRLQVLLETFGLTALAGRKAPSLSGGERQRVALARALASNPSLLLLDEPFNALDQEARRDLRPALKHWLAQAGVPAILVSHDPEDILSLCTRCAVMMQGRIVQEGRVEDVFNHPATEDIARLLGVETLLPGEVFEYRDGLALINTGHFHLQSLTPMDHTGCTVWCAIRAGDITLHTGPAPPTSARNAVPCHVAAVHPQGWLVKVHLAAPGGLTLTAAITRPSWQELSLDPGASVTAVFKAPAVHLIPR